MLLFIYSYFYNFTVKSMFVLAFVLAVHLSQQITWIVLATASAFVFVFLYFRFMCYFVFFLIFGCQCKYLSRETRL